MSLCVSAGAWDPVSMERDGDNSRTGLAQFTAETPAAPLPRGAYVGNRPVQPPSADRAHIVEVPGTGHHPDPGIEVHPSSHNPDPGIFLKSEPPERRLSDEKTMTLEIITRHDPVFEVTIIPRELLGNGGYLAPRITPRIPTGTINVDDGNIRARFPTMPAVYRPR